LLVAGNWLLGWYGAKTDKYTENGVLSELPVKKVTKLLFAA